MIGKMGFGGWWTMLFVPMVLALIAYALYYLAIGSSRTGRSSRYRSRRALEILKERYTRGEITEEQFLKMREELEA